MSVQYCLGGEGFKEFINLCIFCTHTEHISRLHYNETALEILDLGLVFEVFANMVVNITMEIGSPRLHRYISLKAQRQYLSIFKMYDILLLFIVKLGPKMVDFAQSFNGKESLQKLTCPDLD